MNAMHILEAALGELAVLALITAAAAYVIRRDRDDNDE